MKMLISLIMVSIVIAATTGCNNVELTNQDKQTSNVGDNQSYQYVITSIQGDEIYGKAINKISDDNHGIFLYQEEVSFNVNVGNKLAIVWDKEEDIFKSIEKIK